MMRYLIIIVIAFVVFSLVILPSIDAVTSGALTIKPELITIISDRSTYFTGKLTDNNEFPGANKLVVLKQFDTWWMYVAEGYTDAKGNYKITVNENFWKNYKQVTVVTSSEWYSIQSIPVTRNIKKQYSSVTKQKNT